MKLFLVSVMILLAFSVSACSSKSGRGVGEGEDGLGDGNIPLAEVGSELRDVNFDYDSSALDADAQSILRQNARWLLDNPKVSVVVEGHCDERGTAEYNLALGEKRAQAAFDFLRSLGVATSRMSTISYGEELPLDSSQSEEAFAKNRRAHLSTKK